MNLEAYITPEVLRWARESAGFGIDKVVEKLAQKRVTPTTVTSWEAGEARPTYTQLEKLAAIYKRPIALFFLPEPPEEETLAEKFRSLPAQYINELPPGIRFIVREARVRQLELAELHNGAPPQELKQLKLSTTNIKQIAREVRGLLGVSLNQQKEWKDEMVALKNWRNKLDNFGLWIFKKSFQRKPDLSDKEMEEYDGFYLPDDHFPVIYINNNKSKSRQIFTLFHELGHFLLSKGGLCFRSNLEQELKGKFQKEEIFCNAFAGEFLVPDDDLTLSQMPSDSEIKNYATKYKVSREVILRKCKDKQLIDWYGYNQKKEDWESEYNVTQKNKPTRGGNYYLNQKVYLGNRYLKLAFSQYYQQKISESQLADYLGVKVNSLSQLEVAMYQGESE